jgi:hypothetical protein
MKEVFIEHRFNKESQKLVEIVNSILDEYRNLGYRLSVRQLYYQLVSRDYIENLARSYKRIVGLVSDARQAGLVDWEMIEDRGRETVVNPHWSSPAEIIRASAKHYGIDRWEGQPCYVEVMVEKDALSGIMVPVCRKLDIRFTANKGYSSNSALYEAGKRFSTAMNRGLRAHLFYLGDHDPSGIDMTRDIGDRLDLFTYRRPIAIHRLALNYDQVEQWQPPENPAKENDKRYRSYKEKYGKSSWELDAVEPRILAGLVEEAVRQLIDPFIWQEVEKKELEMRQELENYADQFENK